MNIVTSTTMSEIESAAYRNGYAEKDFMEHAGQGIVNHAQDFLHSHDLTGPILLLCGKGNNAGDALVAGYYLMQNGFTVSAILTDPVENCSPLCKQNYHRFKDHGGQIIQASGCDFAHFSIILDGLFGTGFRGETKDPYASLIKAANASGVPILAIDIPSGLNGNTGEASKDTIHATMTLFLGLPKLGFFLQNGWNYVGQLKYVDFGLPQQYIDQAPSSYQWSTHEMMRKLLPSIARNRHKYQAGQVVGLAGSPSMPGAALLSSLAALRGGCGLVRLLYPRGMEAELSGSFYELIKESYDYERPQDVLSVVQKAKSVFIGPGIGCSDKIGHFLNQVIPHLTVPCVIDADALTLFSKNAFLKPEKAVFTPHMGEMQRLLHSDVVLGLNPETINACQEYVEKHQITLVLKGAPTFIFQPDSPVYINTTGSPGMATAGSGDVLTGLIASLLAQGLCCHDAAILGVYLHGLAGEYAAEIHTDRCMIASDIIDAFQYSYQSFDE